jgi:hypothetical protein
LTDDLWKYRHVVAAPTSTPTPRRTPIDRRGPLVLAVDALAVVVFVIIGRRSHDEGSALGGIVAVSAPFLLALGVAWLAGGRWRRSANSAMDVRFGLCVWAVTVILGLLARRFLFARSTAASFVVVASIVLGLFLVGWRAVAAAVARRRA